MDRTMAAQRLEAWCAATGCRDLHQGDGGATFRLPVSGREATLRDDGPARWLIETALPAATLGIRAVGQDAAGTLTGLILARPGSIFAESAADGSLRLRTPLFFDGLSGHAFAQAVFELDRSAQQVAQALGDMEQRLAAVRELDTQLQEQSREADRMAAEARRASEEFDREMAAAQAAEAAAAGLAAPPRPAGRTDRPRPPQRRRPRRPPQGRALAAARRSRPALASA
jgi:hypothetical protein